GSGRTGPAQRHRLGNDRLRVLDRGRKAQSTDGARNSSWAALIDPRPDEETAHRTSLRFALCVLRAASSDCPLVSPVIALAYYAEYQEGVWARCSRIRWRSSPGRARASDGVSPTALPRRAPGS